MEPAEAFDVARELADAVPGAIGPNPRVGCVILDRDGRPVGRGAHLGPGTPHAEVHALREAGPEARGATVVVTLEPCNHHGRTPPCTQALIGAGVDRVLFAVADPTAAGGGADALRAAGILAEQVPDEGCRRSLEPWVVSVQRGRPWVTYKVATTLDGYVAARDGSSRWITSEAARRSAHELRSRVDAILVGTGTLAADAPELTVRLPGVTIDRPPARVVMGLRPVPSDYLHLATRDPADALQRLFEAGVRHVLLEGGPTLGAAFLQAGAVDELLWVQAPLLLGAGTRAIAPLGIDTLADAQRWRVDSVTQKGPDVVLRLRRG